jgi:hypothetical protein
MSTESDFKESGIGKICVKKLKIPKKNSQVTLFPALGLKPQYPGGGGGGTAVLQRDFFLQDI